MSGGLPGMFLEMAMLGAFSLLTSAVLLDELDEKLRWKFKVSEEDARAIRAKLEDIAELFSPTATLSAVKDDPDDNRVLECAVEGEAHFVVTGDRHLLRLGMFHSMPILRVREFINVACVPK